MSSCLHPLQAQRRWLLHTPGSTLPKAGCKGQAPERKMMVPGPSLLGRLCVDKPPPPGRGALQTSWELLRELETLIVTKVARPASFYF